MPATLKDWARRASGALFVLSGNAAAEYAVNLPEPVTPSAREIYDIHMLTLGIATALMIIVTALIAYSVWAHRKSRGAQADSSFHENWFGRWGWVIVPVLVLGVDLTIAGSAQRTLERVWHVPDEPGMLDVKVTGHQWWWQYDYLDHDVRVESRALPEEKAGDLYLREVDNVLVLPTHTKIRFLHTSADVLHAFWVPELGFKKDAIPGYVTETWAEIQQEGVFRGQCAELCGTWHSRMPVVVKAVSPSAFNTWLEQRKSELQVEAAAAASDKEWTTAELMSRGEETYNTKCASCHQPNGQGLPPAFPPLKGSKVVLGPLEKHVQTVLDGVPGTAMQAWNQLSDLEVAAIITYERNAWGNDTGDTVQPKQVAGLREESRTAKR